MAVATVALNELVGPVLFKTALDRTGESAGQAEEDEAPEAVGLGAHSGVNASRAATRKSVSVTMPIR